MFFELKYSFIHSNHYETVKKNCTESRKYQQLINLIENSFFPFTIFDIFLIQSFNITNWIATNCLTNNIFNNIPLKFQIKNSVKMLRHEMTPLQKIRMKKKR